MSLMVLRNLILQIYRRGRQRCAFWRVRAFTRKKC